MGIAHIQYTNAYQQITMGKKPPAINKNKQ